MGSSLLAFILGMFCKVLMVINNLSDKLLIHDNNYTVFFLCIVLMPALLYATKNIPLYYTVYEQDTMAKLDVYEY